MKKTGIEIWIGSKSIFLLFFIYLSIKEKDIMLSVYEKKI